MATYDASRTHLLQLIHLPVKKYCITYKTLHPKLIRQKTWLAYQFLNWRMGSAAYVLGDITGGRNPMYDTCYEIETSRAFNSFKNENTAF